MSDPPTLYGARLRLRPIAMRDAEALFPIFSDEETMRYWSRAPFAEVARLREWIRPDATWPAWVIESDGAVIGRIALGQQRPRVAEIGYAVSRTMWGRGFAREAVAAVLAFAFGAAGMRRVFADVDPDNVASVKLLTSLGFVEEGRLRAEWETHLGIRDSLIFGLLANEWDGIPTSSAVKNTASGQVPLVTG
ncbi:MAG: N-acetyltransferase [Sphingomonadales bacterium]|nr:MAG: N-acetyltransferase [Sphingomonadales bacterium]